MDLIYIDIIVNECDVNVVCSVFFFKKIGYIFANKFSQFNCHWQVTTSFYHYPVYFHEECILQVESLLISEVEKNVKKMSRISLSVSFNLFLLTSKRLFFFLFPHHVHYKISIVIWNATNERLQWHSAGNQRIFGRLLIADYAVERNNFINCITFSVQRRIWMQIEWILSVQAKKNTHTYGKILCRRVSIHWMEQTSQTKSMNRFSSFSLANTNCFPLTHILSQCSQILTPYEQKPKNKFVISRSCSLLRALCVFILIFTTFAFLKGN